MSTSPRGLGFPDINASNNRPNQKCRVENPDFIKMIATLVYKTSTGFYYLKGQWTAMIAHLFSQKS